MNQLLTQSFQIPVNNWGFPHFVRTGLLRENDNWREISGDLGTKLYWMLESLQFNLDYMIGEVSFHREYTIKMPLHPHERCCKVPTAQCSDTAGQDWYATLCQYSFSPVMRLERGFDHINNIQQAKQTPVFATRFAFEEQDMYYAYSITTHPIDIEKRIVDKKRIVYEGSHFDLYLVSDVPNLDGKIMSGVIEGMYFETNKRY